MENFLQPENLTGLNMFKQEISVKLKEKEQLEQLTACMQQQLRDAMKINESLSKGNQLVQRESAKLNQQSLVR